MDARTAGELESRYLRELANVAVAELSSDGVIRRANTYAESLTGRSLCGRSISDIIVDFSTSGAPDRWWQPTEEPRLTNVETAAGIPQTLYVTVWELADGLLWCGQTDGAEQELLRSKLLGLNRELGHLTRELANKNAELARLDALKNQFLGMAAHDLRNPIHLIMGYAELMDSDTEPSLAPDHRDYVGAIIRSSERMAGLIDSFLDVSLIDAGRFPLELAPIDVPRLVKTACDAIGPTALKRRITIRTRIDDAPPRTSGDESKLAQVLINLLSNGVEHSPPDGVLTVGCRAEADGLFFSVTDSGTGMDEAARDRLFSAFSGTLQRKSDGTRSIGLGLMIAHKIVTAHGGHMAVESQPGVGSVFGFTVPGTVPAEPE